MSFGSVIGAGLGGLAIAIVPVGSLKLLLGCVLLAAAGKDAARASVGERPLSTRNRPRGGPAALGRGRVKRYCRGLNPEHSPK